MNGTRRDGVGKGYVWGAGNIFCGAWLAGKGERGCFGSRLEFEGGV